MFASGSLSPFMGFIKGEVFCLPLWTFYDGWVQVFLKLPNDGRQEVGGNFKEDLKICFYVKILALGVFLSGHGSSMNVVQSVIWLCGDAKYVAYNFTSGPIGQGNRAVIGLNFTINARKLGIHTVYLLCIEESLKIVKAIGFWKGRFLNKEDQTPTRRCGHLGLWGNSNRYGFVNFTNVRWKTEDTQCETMRASITDWSVQKSCCTIIGWDKLLSRQSRKTTKYWDKLSLFADVVETLVSGDWRLYYPQWSLPLIVAFLFHYPSIGVTGIDDEGGVIILKSRSMYMELRCGCTWK